MDGVQIECDNMLHVEISEDVVTYEEVALYYPRAEHKRPVVLIGPPNIGRHELRQRLMLDQERFAAAIPHTSRLKRAQEVDGADYHFISRLQVLRMHTHWNHDKILTFILFISEISH